MPGEYDFTPQKRDQILAEIRRRLPAIRCPLCNHEKWTIPDGFIHLPLMENFWLSRRGKGNLVGVALVCDTCGNTVFINLGPLGLEDLAAPKMEDVLKKWGVK